MKYQFLLIFGALALTQGCDSSSSSSKEPAGAPNTQAPGENAVGGTGTPGETTAPGESPTGGTVTPEAAPYVIPGNSFNLVANLKTTRSGFLKDLGEGVSDKVVHFQTASEELSAAADAYCGSYSVEAQAALKDKFKNAMLIWQELELYQMGPMLEKNSSLKARIYNWPIVPYLCKIDEESMYALEDGDAYAIPGDYNKIGLQALEYLIFDETLETGCPAGLIKNNWTALDRQTRIAARCAYMKPVARDLVAAAQILKTSWGTSENNYLSRKLGDAVGEQGAMQEMFNNILYIDIEMKNKKLGIPAGQDIKGCPKSPAPCVDKQELRYSRLSREALDSNVQVLADLIFGFGEPRRGGLSAILRHENAAAAAEKSEKNVSDLLTLVESDKSDLDTLLNAKTNEDCLATQLSWVCRVQNSIKVVVADFKAEYASVLKVQVPVEKQGDND